MTPEKRAVVSAKYKAWYRSLSPEARAALIARTGAWQRARLAAMSPAEKEKFRADTRLYMREWRKMKRERDAG